MDRQTFAIGTLSITALILLVALVITSQLPAPQPAMGMGQVVSGGDYIMLTGQLQSSNELVYLIDVAVKQMVVYWFDPSRNRLNVVQHVDLSELPTQNPPRRR